MAPEMKTKAGTENPFIQMVSPKTHESLRAGEAFFTEGAEVEPAFHIVRGGALHVSKGGAKIGGPYLL